MRKEIKKLLNSLTSYNCSWGNQSQYYLGESGFGTRAYFNLNWKSEIVEVIGGYGDSRIYNFIEFQNNIEELVDQLKVELKSIDFSLPKRKDSNPYSLTDEERKLYNIE